MSNIFPNLIWDHPPSSVIGSLPVVSLPLPCLKRFSTAFKFSHLLVANVLTTVSTPSLPLPPQLCTYTISYIWFQIWSSTHFHGYIALLFGFLYENYLIFLFCLFLGSDVDAGDGSLMWWLFMVVMVVFCDDARKLSRRNVSEIKRLRNRFGNSKKGLFFFFFFFKEIQLLYGNF